MTDTTDTWETATDDALADAMADNDRLPPERQLSAEQIAKMVANTAAAVAAWAARTDLPSADERLAMQALGRAIYRRMHAHGVRTELGVQDATAVAGEPGPRVAGLRGFPVPLPAYEDAPRLLRWRAVKLAEQAIEAALANVDAWNDIWLREENKGVEP